MTDKHTSASIIAALVAAAGCTPAAPGAPVPATNKCVVVDDSARPHITFGASRLNAGDPADREMAHAQVYETLVRIDCTGRVVPGLAVGWSSSDNRTWRFHIRRGASFDDGTPVNAQSVAASLAMLPMLAGVVAAGEHDLRVKLHEQADVRSFAGRALAVRRIGMTGRPAGSGQYEPVFDGTRISKLVARSSGGPDALGPVSQTPDTIAVRTFGRDLRAAIDAGVDALVTNDAATIDYARARSVYSIAPLTWNRTYVLATAAGRDAVGDVPAAAFPAALVGAVARPAQPPFWWTSCSPAAAAAAADVRDADRPDAGRSLGVAGEAANGRIVFLRDDPVGRSIAERIAALARGRAPAWLSARLPEGGAPIALGLEAAELLQTLRIGSALAVVMPLPRFEHGACGPASVQIHTELLDGWHVTPLIDTRDDLVYRPGIGRVAVDADGTLLFGAR